MKVLVLRRSESLYHSIKRKVQHY